MGGHAVALYREAVRGTKPDIPAYEALTIKGKVMPKFDPKDEFRKEFRGTSTALGNQTARRKESGWSHGIEGFVYPVKATSWIYLFALGHATDATVIDVTAHGRVFSPVANPYAATELGSAALGYGLNEEMNEAVQSRHFGGGRIKSLGFTFKGTEDVAFTADITGDGKWISQRGAAIAGLTFPAIDPFCSADTKFYIGTGVTLTLDGNGNVTGIAPGTMQQFIPEDFSIKVTTGLDDKRQVGPLKTARTGQFNSEIDLTIDYEDPNSGFSSYDEFNSTFDGVQTNGILVEMDNGQIAGSTNQHYKTYIYQPLGLLSTDSPDLDVDGKTPNMKLKYKSMVDPTIGKPLMIYTIDKVATLA
jgi:hypothetical protein